MILTDTPVQPFLSQQPPFVMVDRLVDFNEKSGVTELTILDDNIFVDNHEFSAAGLLENMAQSCAVRTGFANRKAGGAVKTGVIGSIRNFTVLRLPRCGEVISTYIIVDDEVFNMSSVSLLTKVGDELVAMATLKIALVDAN